jgi:hypothetical protein
VENSTILALVALDPDRIELAGTGFKHHYELALYGGWIDCRLRRGEPVRTGAP